MKGFFKKLLVSAVLFTGITAYASAQVTTASTYFKTVSEYYASLKTTK